MREKPKKIWLLSTRLPTIQFLSKLNLSDVKVAFSGLPLGYSSFNRDVINMTKIDSNFELPTAPIWTISAVGPKFVVRMSK